jgi:hypothetical protein
VSKLFMANQFQQGLHNEQAKQLAPVDEPQVFILGYDYALPCGRGKTFLEDANGVVQKLVGSWGIAGIQTYNFLEIGLPEYRGPRVKASC